MKRPLSNTLAVVVMAILAAYFLLPIWWALVESTKLYAAAFSTNPLWFSNPTFFNFVYAFTQSSLLLWLANSLIESGLAGILGALLAAMAGFALGKYTFRGRHVLTLVVAVGLMIPSTAIAFPTFVLEQQLGLVNTYQGVIFPTAVSAFGTYFMTIYAQESIPKEVLDAARIDGASEWQVFTSVALRYFKPAIVTIFIIIFAGTWNNYLLPLFVLRNASLYMLPQGLASVLINGSTFPNLQYAIQLSGSVVTILLMVGLFIGLEKYIEAGLGLGAVRG
ncbi:MAG: carbohydrate ABC transporter permease [Nitrososphaerota archaeon]|nr:carbohydrate ABC transporter permease [Nitrososphaerota archaeon]MDG6970916.1 carbohydrate ABC transporter permease [Nitrososphaerota archaeon]MDG6975646.1 carbohydrate ABC transporter permease [Nitrososphaerota archaeon]